MTVADVIINVCMNCNYFNQEYEVCSGEILPIEHAIQKNAEGRGCCSKVKEWITQKMKENK